jgi:hypothetical protein
MIDVIFQDLENSVFKENSDLDFKLLYNKYSRYVTDGETSIESIEHIHLEELVIAESDDSITYDKYFSYVPITTDSKHSTFNLTIDVENNTPFDIYISSLNNSITKVPKSDHYNRMFKNNTNTSDNPGVNIRIGKRLRSNNTSHIRENPPVYYSSKIYQDEFATHVVYVIPELNMYIARDKDLLEKAILMTSSRPLEYSLTNQNGEKDVKKYNIMQIYKYITAADSVIVNDVSGKLNLKTLKAYFNNYLFTIYVMKSYDFPDGIYVISNDTNVATRISLYRFSLDDLSTEILSKGYAVFGFKNKTNQIVISPHEKTIKSIIDKYGCYINLDENEISKTPTILEYQENIRRLKEEIEELKRKYDLDIEEKDRKLRELKDKHQAVIEEKDRKIRELNERVNLYLTREKEQARSKVNEYSVAKASNSYSESSVKAWAGVTVAAVSVVVTLLALFKR